MEKTHLYNVVLFSTCSRGNFLENRSDILEILVWEIGKFLCVI